jgi:hypothetical protein
MYRQMYEGLPPVRSLRDFRSLPVLTAARRRATPLREQIDTPDDTLRTFTPFVPGSVVPAAPFVADHDDSDMAFDECRDAFKPAGVRAGMDAVVLTPPIQRYVAAEIAERLGYFGVQVHVVVHHDDGTTAALLRALAPRAIIRVGRMEAFAFPPASGQDGQRGRQPVVGAGRDQTGTPVNVQVRGCTGAGRDIYLVPEAGFVAVRAAGESSYLPLRSHYYLEAEPGGTLLLTALHRFHQPLIRCELADRGRIENGRLWLDEVAP